MKSFLILSFSLITFIGQAQITKAFDFQCNCTIVTNRYDNGKKSNEHQLNNDGKKDGPEVAYYATGKKQFERNWKNGKLDGKATHYHRDGSVYYEEFHSNGVKTGEWTFRDTDGDIIQTIDYSKGPNNSIHSYFHAGVKYFTQELENGKMVSETIHNQVIYDQLKEEAEADKAKKQ